jgi:hypothetical protein
MLTWFAMSVAGAGLGYAAVYLALNVKPAPTPPAEPPAIAGRPAAPAVLPQVVEVTDTDPLLDPAPGRPAGAPFDTVEPPAKVPAQSADPPVPIPLAVD